MFSDRLPYVQIALIFVSEARMGCSNYNADV